MTSIGNSDPVELDLSDNYFRGSNAKKGNNKYIVQSLGCEGYAGQDSARRAVDDLIYLKAKQVGKDSTAATELDAGCLVVDYYDTDLIARDMGSLLLKSKLNLKGCVDGGVIVKSYGEFLRDPRTGQWFDQIGTNPFAPKFVTSGPSLSAIYTAGLAEYVGTSDFEKIYQDRPCSSKEEQVFRGPAGSSISTGITFSMDGDCIERGLRSDNYRYDGVNYENADAAARKNCPDNGCCLPCSTYIPQGVDALPCEKSKQCYPYDTSALKVPRKSGSDYSTATKGCGVPWQLQFHIGNYAETNLIGLNTEHNGYKIFFEMPLPLSTYKKNQDDIDLNIAFSFSSSRPLPQSGGNPYDWDSSLDFGRYGQEIPLVTTSKAYADYWATFSPSLANESKKVGTLTLKSGQWSSNVPLWTLYSTAKKSSCIGSYVSEIGEGGANWIMACTRKTISICKDDCECCFGRDGCGSPTGKTECDEIEFCEPKICSYSYKSSYKVECNDLTNCGGCQSLPFGNERNCACCKCECDGPYDFYNEEGFNDCCIYNDPCPAQPKQPATVVSGGGLLGCFGDGMEQDTFSTNINITLEFVPFTALGGT
jgi:hypothetical protein